MLTLLFVSLYEFKQFLQIVLWIAIPGTVIAALVTTWLHFRRKKALANQPDLLDNERLAIAGDMGQLPDWLASGDPDNTSLLKKYEREVRRYKENYGTLEQDYRELEQKYADLLNKAYHHDQNDNETVDRLQQELKGYKLKIAQLQQALEYNQHTQEAENNSGQDTMELHQLRIAVSELRQENALLKERLEDQKYMEDLLQEKKLQADFLQQQLEQRIKNYHQLEKQTGQSTVELQQLREAANEYKRKEQTLQEELRQKHEELTGLQSVVEGTREESRQHEEILRHKMEQLGSLESRLEELQQQQSSLQTVIDQKEGAIAELENNIGREQLKAKELENKLEMSSQLFVRIYSELAKSIQAGLVPSQNGHGAALLQAPVEPVDAAAAVIGQAPTVN